MDGVILFADDKIHDCSVEEGAIKRSNENALFDSLSKDLPVLGVNCLELAEKSIASIGTFSAIILDWEFGNPTFEDSSDDETAKLVRPPSSKQQATMKFLEDNEFYSLIYIYSDRNISESTYGQKLRDKFKNRIQIEQKINITNTEEAKAKIISDIKEWKDKNQNLALPLVWSASINKSTQQIFNDLSEADASWIKDIYDTAAQDGVDAALFVIEIFQYLLSEKLIQNETLRNSIEELANTGTPNSDESSIAKLFRRLLYTQLTDVAPIMTGDICEIGGNKFGIIITPECDIGKILSNEENKFELLVFEDSSFNSYLLRNKQYTKQNYLEWQNGNNKQKDKLEDLRQIFNQNESRFHIFPSFPIDDNLNNPVVIEFSLGCDMYTCREVKEFRRRYKLNSPHIQQLRQRYISHLGRVGSPSLPMSLRNFNLR